MFELLWGYLKDVREGKQIDYPLSESPTPDEVRKITASAKVNDFIVCPNRREARRVVKLLKAWDCDCITRSIMHNGKPSIKIWRIR